MRSRVVGVSPLATHRRRRPLVLMVRFLVLPRTGGPGHYLTSARSEADAGYDRMRGAADSAYPRRTGPHSREQSLAEKAAPTDVGSGASVSS